MSDRASSLFMKTPRHSLSRSLRGILFQSLLLAVAAGCDTSSNDYRTPGGGAGAVSAAGAGGTTSGGASAGAPTDAGTGGNAGAPALGLRGAPLLFAPTADEFGISAALVGGDPSTLRARVRVEGQAAWGELETPEVRAADLAEWRIPELEPNTRYEYQVVALGEENDEVTLYSGSAVTQRPEQTAFTFALITDTHIGADLEFSNQGDETKTSAISKEIEVAAPDFIVNLGDMLDFHQFGFNDPPPTADIARLAYLNYREALGDTLGRAAHFPVIGNWDGENGDFTAEEIERSRSQRWLYAPSPGETTYPEGAGPERDYYAFTWGDALFVVLNVMSYTPTEQLLSTVDGSPEAWTLGEEQLAWLGRTLENASAKWRFLLIHHAVGGAAGTVANAIYGRGGGQAANVGEQAEVHRLMLEHGVQIFFYGHDHVFTDMVVDGIHYSMPGNAGAIWTFDTYDTGYTQYWAQSGWSRVDVTPETVHVQFIAQGGELLYEYTVEN
jgi:3',5'-cyclic AMP phosphodiesterase CpdA